jgi:ankyrin repeat protein
MNNDERDAQSLTLWNGDMLKPIEEAFCLLELGAHVDENAPRMGRGLTPLEYAMYSRDTEMVRMLLTSKPDLDLMSFDVYMFKYPKDIKRTITEDIENTEKIVLMIVTYAANIGYICHPQNHYKILAFACDNFCVESVELLLERGINPNATSLLYDNNALFLVIDHMYERDAYHTRGLKIVKLLTYAGTDINHINKYERTALSAALNFKYNDIVTFLIQNGANIEIRDRRSKDETKDSITLINDCRKLTEEFSVIFNCFV